MHRVYPYGLQGISHAIDNDDDESGDVDCDVYIDMDGIMHYNEFMSCFSVCIASPLVSLIQMYYWNSNIESSETIDGISIFLFRSLGHQIHK